jgi:hypothetical protein
MVEMGAMEEEDKRQARGAEPGLVQGAWVASSVTGADVSPPTSYQPRPEGYASEVQTKSRSPPSGHRVGRRGDYRECRGKIFKFILLARDAYIHRDLV